MRFFLIIGLIIWLVASSESVGMWDQKLEVLRSVNKFEEELFERVVQQTEGSFAYAPLSLWLILSEAAAGARGRTEEQMKTALRLPAIGNHSEGLRDIVRQSRDLAERGMHMAQLMFLDEKLKPKDEFTEILRDSFMTGTMLVDFNDEMGPSRIINEWSAIMTQRQVKNVTRPSELSSSTSMLLVSSMYFKSFWRSPFYPNNTEMRTFRVNPNRNVSVLTMCAQATYSSVKMPGIEADVIELEFQQVPGQLFMIIVLPRSVDGLAEVERKMKDFPTSWFYNLNFRRSFPRQLCLPKFKIKSKIPLKAILRKMKMRHMFSKIKANFSGISDSQNIRVSDLIHNVILEVDEEGRWEDLSYPVLTDTPKPIIVDRPFLGFVADRTLWSVKLLTFRYTGPEE